jgi:hypothetical protein
MATANKLDDAPTRGDVDALTHITAGLEKRLDEHDTLIGRDGEKLKQLMADAFREAIDQTITDPMVWAKVRGAMVQQTQGAAGRWVLGGVVTGFKALCWAALVGLGLYILGGWKLVGAVLASMGLGSSGGGQ